MSRRQLAREQARMEAEERPTRDEEPSPERKRQRVKTLPKARPTSRRR
jgi:hypothetical protein